MELEKILNTNNLFKYLDELAEQRIKLQTLEDQIVGSLNEIVNAYSYQDLKDVINYLYWERLELKVGQLQEAMNILNWQEFMAFIKPKPIHCQCGILIKNAKSRTDLVNHSNAKCKDCLNRNILEFKLAHDWEL